MKSIALALFNYLAIIWHTQSSERTKSEPPPFLKLLRYELGAVDYIAKPFNNALQGIDAEFCPKLLNTDIYDEIITVKEEDAYSDGWEIAAREGNLIGISSGADVWAAPGTGRQEYRRIAPRYR